MSRTPFAAAVVAAVILSGCASLNLTSAPPPPPYNPEGQPVLLEPLPVAKVVDGMGNEVFWASLTEAQRRLLLPNTDTVVVVERRNSDGTFSITPATASASKGYYRVTFMYMKYRNEVCLPSNPDAGTVRIGVGLRVSAEIQTRSGGINLGNLLPIAISANDKKVTGRLSIRTVGIGSSSSVLSGYLKQGVGVTEEAIVNAMESMAVAKAVMEDNDTQSIPHAMAIVERTPGACRGIVGATPQPSA